MLEVKLEEVVDSLMVGQGLKFYKCAFYHNEGEVGLKLYTYKSLQSFSVGEDVLVITKSSKQYQTVRVVETDVPQPTDYSITYKWIEASAPDDVRQHEAKMMEAVKSAQRLAMRKTLLEGLEGLDLPKIAK